MKRNLPYAQHIAFTGSVRSLFDLLVRNEAKARYRYRRRGRDAELRAESYTAALVWEQARALEPPAGCAELSERLVAAAHDQAALFSFWLHGAEEDIAAFEVICREHTRWMSIALGLVSYEIAWGERRRELVEEAVGR